MAATKVLGIHDFSSGSIIGVTVENLSSAPSSPAKGRMYFDSTLNQFGIYSGTVWVYLAASAAADANTLTGTTLASNVVSSSLISFGSQPAANNFIEGYSTTATAAGTTTLTVSSNFLQFFTGSTTQTVTLPVASTLVLGQQFLIVNNSTGVVTIQSSGSNAVQVLAAGASALITCILASGTTAASWNSTYIPASIASYVAAQTWTGVQTFGAAGNVGKFVLAGNTSGSTILNAAAVASGTLTLPAATDTLVGKATTDIFTNKTFDAAGTGNSLSNIATSMFATNVIDTDTALTANSDTRIASQKAVKAYIDGIATSGMHFKGVIDASANPNYPAATIGDMYKISVAGKIGGASGQVVTAGDTIVCITTAAAGNDATVGTSWDIVQANVDQATTSTLGLVALATSAQAIAKSSTVLAVTPAALANFTQKVIATIGDGSTTSIAVSDNLGTLDKIAEVRDATTGVKVLVDITYASNTTTFVFAVAPATNAYKVTIIG